MNVAFITIHIGSNFGSNLQTIATSRILTELGHNPICINYIPERVTQKRYWKSSLSSPVGFLKNVILYPKWCINKYIFKKYLTKYVRLTKAIYRTDNFVKCCPKVPVYITGSDQVWNTKYNEGIDTHYFFEGVEGTKIAFASSIGSDSLSSEEIKIFPSLLKSYKSISVREQEAQKALESIGIKSTLLLDPTFLLSKEEWSNYMTKRLIKSPYLCVYTPYNTVDKDVIYRAARIVANKNGLKVVTFGLGYTKERLSDKTIYYANPGDFLSLMANADYTITNSFHGTAFSVNLNKQFSVFLPSGFTSRISSLLNILNLSSRIINNENQLTDEKIDYTRINDLLTEERKRSVAFLKENLEVC